MSAINLILEIKDLQRENSQLRCQVAELKEKLNRNENALKSLEIEKKRTDKELKVTQGQAHSVRMVMCRNELVKQKLAQKILKSHPQILDALEEKGRDRVGRRSFSHHQNKKGEIVSYQKKIWELERQKRELEAQIHELRGKQNRLQFQLKKYDGMEKQILWTEKAMVKLEGDRNRLEELMKSMTLNVPKKLPFEKFVTDPSILDRMATYKVLQTRLMQQSEKVEKLKKSAVKIMEVD